MSESTSETNIKLNKQFSDQPLTTSKKSLSAAEANEKLQDEFYGVDTNKNIATTYLYNNTPAIKITGDDD